METKHSSFLRGQITGEMRLPMINLFFECEFKNIYVISYYRMQVMEFLNKEIYYFSFESRYKFSKSFKYCVKYRIIIQYVVIL